MGEYTTNGSKIKNIGFAPFKGNLSPETSESIISEYRSVHTFSIQFSFKYDNNPDEVKKSIKTIKNGKKSPAQEIDEEKYLPIIKDYGYEYQKHLFKLVNIINEVSKHVPSRRKRKLHIGMFGYSVTWTVYLFHEQSHLHVPLFNRTTSRDIRT